MKQLALFLALGSTALALELTPDNWDAETEGKTVFIKFFAPVSGFYFLVTSILFFFLRLVLKSFLY